MNGDELEARVDQDRRRFVRRLLTGAAFAVPVVSSFDMSNLSMNAAFANATGANQVSP